MTKREPTTMKIASAASTAAQAAAQLCEQVTEGLAGRPAHLAMLLCAGPYAPRLQLICDAVLERLSPGRLIGASGEHVIRDDHEFEERPGVVLWAAHLPGVRVQSLHLSQEELQRIEGGQALVEHLGIDPADEPSFVLLGDPFSINVLALLDRLAEAYPRRPAIGGLASSGSEAGENVLVFDGHVLHHGLAGVALSGAVRIDTIVSQGCRPIGRHAVITKAERNIIRQLGGRPPLQVVSDLLDACSESDRELLQHNGLFVGRVIDEHRPRFDRGDFLIRNAIGFDRESGALAINDYVRPGQTVQFHVRDALAADEDLRALLQAAPAGQAAGALLFSCTGRGTRLFEQPHHDAQAVFAHTGGAPLAGFFCAGEIGPVGARNFVHGHTAAVALLSPAEA